MVSELTDVPNPVPHKMGAASELMSDCFPQYGIVKKIRVFHHNAKTPAMPLTAFRGGGEGGKATIQYHVIFC